MRLALLATFVLAASAAAAHAAPEFPELPKGGAVEDCAPGRAAAVCRVRAELSPEAARARLGARDLAWWAEGDIFTVVAQHGGEVLNLCCAIQAPMARLPGTDLWTLSVRIPNLRRAVLDIAPIRGGRYPLVEWRGPEAPSKRTLAEPLAGRVVEQTVASRHLGHDRGLSIYLPPGHDPALRYPVIYMADGQSVSMAASAIEPLISAGEVRPLIIVGIHSGENRQRMLDYLPNFGVPPDPAPFAVHEAFVVEEVMPLAEARFGASTEPNERMVAGHSNGAAWAIASALRQPRRFGHAAALSFAWTHALEGLGGSEKPRLFLAAGTLEGVFHTRTVQAAKRGRAERYDVTLVTPVSGHAFVMWRELYADAAEWAFPAR